MPKMPSLFLSHGGPNIVLDETPARRFLETLSEHIPRPRAIVIQSAHFETGGVAVVTDPAPEMIYDFGGFPQALYEMVYPAPGDTKLAGEVLRLLTDAGLEPAEMARRGYDHGAWTPMMLAFPDADIPIVQVSIDPSRGADWHYRVGAALEPLRDDNVLIVGSGHITHNLKAFFSVMRGGGALDPELPGQIDAFTGWFAETFARGDNEAILGWREKAPHVAANHPTDEHLLPLFFAYGAAGEGAAAERIHSSKTHGFFAYDAYLFR